MDHRVQEARSTTAMRRLGGVRATPLWIARTALSMMLLLLVATPGLGAAGSDATTDPVAVVAPPVAAPPVGSEATLAGRRPDIVVLLLDDMAEIDRRVWERLPTIERLFLQQGTRFVRAFANDPLCCPGRAAILTGQRTAHHRVFHNSARLLDARTTIATELDALGYHTIYAGKYLSKAERLDDLTPPGWDHSLIFSGGYWNLPAWRDGKRFRVKDQPQDYTTDLIARTASRWLRDAPAEAPLLLFLSPFAVHWGLDERGRSAGVFQPAAAPRHRGDPRCAGIPAWRPPNHAESDVTDKPAHIQAQGFGPYPDGWPLRTICETLLSVDELLAQVESELAAQGRGDVLFLLTSDNGMAWGAHRWSTKRIPYATPIPLYLHWAAGLGTERRTVKASVSNIDLAPTLCALAGCRMGPFPNGFPVDGLSLLPLLDGRATRPSRELLFEEHFTRYLGPRWVGVRTAFGSPLGRWVYTRYETGEEELYDVAADRYQLRNLAGDPAHEAMRARLADAVRETYGPDETAFRP